MGSFYMESTQINYRRDETVKTVDQKLQELSETSAIDTDIAPVFKSTNTYAPGDMVYYRNKLYVFNVEHTGAWAAGDVTATDVTTEVSSLRSGLTNVDVALSVPVGTGKNLIPLSLDNYKAYSTTGTWAGNVYSVNGIDFTVNTDANGAVTSISASGTASALAMLELTMAGKKGEYTLNGCPSGGSAGYYVQIYKSGFIDVKDRGDGVSVNFGSDKNVRVICAIGEGLEVTNLTFYPMLRLASVSDPTFAPYIPSVESRIEALENSYSETILTIENANITAERKSVKRFGKVCVIDLIFTVSAAITGNTTLLFSGAPKAKTFAENNFRFTAVEMTNANIVPAVMNIDNNGKMYNQWTTGGIQPGTYTANATYICQ